MLVNSTDHLLYNLSYLSSVIHPVIILRLLEHRLFTPLFKKKAVGSVPSVPTNLLDARPPLVVPSPHMGASALGCLPMLPPLDVSTEKRNSLGNSRKTSRGTPNASISASTPAPESSVTSNNPTDLSLLLTPLTNSAVNSNTTTRKWFWRNSEKNNTQSSSINERNPLLQAISEIPPISSSTSVGSTTKSSVGPTSSAETSVSGPGEMKLFEKELLNLPIFQLSDSQNPLLPSPTCLNYDFPTHFEQATANYLEHAKAHLPVNGLPKSLVPDDNGERERVQIERTEIRSCLFSIAENSGEGLMPTLNVPFVAVRTPSDDSHRSSSFASSVTAVDPNSSASGVSLRKSTKSFFRTSKTTENISGILVNGARRSKGARPTLTFKSTPGSIRSQLSHSQPTVTVNQLFDASAEIDPSEQTPLSEHRSNRNGKSPSDYPNTKSTRLNRQALHLPLDIEEMCCSSSYADGILSPVNQQQEGTSPHSSDSAASSLSAYLSPQQTLNLQLSTNKSQESLFSFSSPVQKQRSFKSLLMSAGTKDQANKQGNEVLFLIASWVLRSPEDFQGH